MDPVNLYLLLFSLFILSSTTTSTSPQPPCAAPSPSSRPPEPFPTPRPPKNTKLPPPEDIDGWCATVPHPGPCRFFMGQKPHVLGPKMKKEFRQLAVQAALDRAVAAQRQSWSWGKGCKSHKERAAWHDCTKLYDYTVMQLNQTLQGLNSSICSDFDAQTWLSTALTNLETCKASTSDLNLTRFMLPHVQYNVSDLVSNILAINEGNFNSGMENTSDSDFPSWVGRSDRRLLRGGVRSLATNDASFVVAKDGSGQYETVQAAINAASKAGGTGRKIIYVRKGVYRENIWVDQHTSNVMMVGDGVKVTLITSARSNRAGYTTYNSATAGIDGTNFMARDITFANSAGNNAGQAVALRSSSDLSVFYRCAFYGYQDTLFVHSQRQFFKNCYVFGTIDIIFGNAAVVFQNTIIYVRRPIKGQSNVVTAQGRYDPNQNTGIVIHNSKIMPAPDLKPVELQVATYLGRPWQRYSRTVIMKSYLGALVNSTGWLEWNSGKGYLNSLYYAEYKNFGPSSNLRSRVRWPGYHTTIASNVASRFSVDNFIAGRAWLPSTGVPFTSGL